MMFLKLSLNVLLYIIVMTMAHSIDENAKKKCYNAINYPLPNILVALHYNLHITLQESGSVSNSESNITIYINRATPNITLRHSKYMNITEVKLKSINSGIIYTPAYSVLYKKEMIFLDFELQLLSESNLECGVYTLYVKFSNTYFNHSMDSNVGKQFIDPALIQMRGTHLFPCWVEPEFCATFNISVEHRKRSKILSNMPIQEHKPIDGDTMRTEFHTTPEMSTKDVAIMMYNVDNLHQVLNSTKTVVNTWCRPHMIPHMKFMQYVAGNVTMYLEIYWKMLKRTPKVDYVAIPNFVDRIWQTNGLVVYNEADIIYNEELHSAAFKTELMRSIAHDITHHWIGNLFNPSCRSHWWLNEGFIMFFETYIMAKIPEDLFPDSRIIDLFIVQIQHESRHLNTYFAKNDFIEYTCNVPKINSSYFFSQIIGAVVWRMIESVIPFYAFWQGIKEYLNTRFTDFLDTPYDLWNLMQIKIHDLNLEGYDMNVKQMMDIWTIQEHCPVLNVTRDYSSGRVIISKEFHDKLDQISYFIPVTYTKETDLDFENSLPNTNSCLTQSNPVLEIQFNDKDKWIIVNIQQAGYYRVNYDTENWRKIARYLNSENYTNIHVLNRAQIIDDAFHLAIEKKLNISIFWELARYLSRDEDYVAWYPMIKVFEYISNIFAFANTRDNLPKVLKGVLLKIESLFEHIEIHMYTQLQIIPDLHDFEKYLKQELAKWGCIIGNSLCMDQAHHQLQLHVTNPKVFKIMPGSQKWIYCNSLKKVNNSVWNNVLNFASSICKAKSDYKMLEFFSCSENPEIIINYLQFVFPAFVEKYLFEDNENKPSAQEKGRLYANMFLSTLARHAKTTTIFEKILKNFKYINHSRVSMNAALCVMINNAYYVEQLLEIRQFAMKNMQQSLSDIEHKLRTRSLEIQNQMNFLQNFFPS